MTPRQVLRAADDELARADALLEIAQVAKRLRVCEESVRRWIRAGKIEAEKLPGGQWRVRSSSIPALQQRATLSNKALP